MNWSIIPQIKMFYENLESNLQLFKSNSNLPFSDIETALQKIPYNISKLQSILKLVFDNKQYKCWFLPERKNGKVVFYLYFEDKGIIKKRNEEKIIGVCPICGKQYWVKKDYHFFNGTRPNPLCKHCACRMAQTIGGGHENFKKNCLKKYGAENPSQNEQIKEKRRKTCLKKYGAESPLACKDIYNKTKQSLMKNYGVSVPMHSTQIKQKFFDTIIERYEDLINEGYSAGIARSFDYSKMVQFFNGREQVVNKLKNIASYKGKTKHYYSSDARSFGERVRDSNKKKYGTSNIWLTPIGDKIRKNNSTLFHSKIADEMFEKLSKQLSYEMIFGDRQKFIEIGGTIYFLDCYIPEKKILIQFYGNYWHCNPLFFKGTDQITIHQKKYLVSDIWKRDENRLNIITNKLDCHAIIVWQYDYRQNKQRVLNWLVKLIQEIKNDQRR